MSWGILHGGTMLSRLIRSRWRTGWEIARSQQFRLACTGDNGSSELGESKFGMDDGIKEQQDDMESEGSKGIAEQDLGNPVAESSGDSFPDPQNPDHQHQEHEDDSETKVLFPVGSPVFGEMSTPKAMEGRLAFLKNALENEVPTEEEVKEKEKEEAAQQPSQKKELTPNDDPLYGYAKLGLSNTPEDMLELPKIHPTRTFHPGMTYQPQELSPVSVGGPTGRRPFFRRSTALHENEAALEQADFKNLAFLNDFVTDAGRLVTRKETKLKASVHRHVMRQVKNARQLGLLPYQDRRPEFRKGPRKNPDNRDASLQQHMVGQTGQQTGP